MLSPKPVRAWVLLLEHVLQRVEDRGLARQDLGPCLGEAVPGGRVDLGEVAVQAAPRRIFEAEAVADDRAGVEIALECEGLHPLSAFLADAAERARLAF